MSQSAVIALLRANTVVNTTTGGRIAAERPEQGDNKPYIIVHEISAYDYMTLGHATGLVQSRLQIDFYGNTPKEASDLERLAGLPTDKGGILNGYRGTAPDGTKIQQCKRVDRRHGQSTAIRKDDRPSFWYQADYLVTYEEA